MPLKFRDVIKLIESDGWVMVVEEIKITEYIALIEKGETNYGAWVPDLDGCVSTSATLEESETNIHETIELHLQGMREDGLPIPEPSKAVLVKVA